VNNLLSVVAVLAKQLVVLARNREFSAITTEPPVTSEDKYESTKRSVDS